MACVRWWYDFCVVFVLFLTIGIRQATSGTRHSNDDYRYEIESPRHLSDHQLHIRSLDEEKTRFPQKRNETTSSTPPSLPEKVNLSVPAKLQHILGFNGTGQRRNVTTVTEKPKLVHIVNATINTPAKTTRTSLEFDDDAEMLFPDSLTPDGDEIDHLTGKNITAVKNDTHIFYNSTMYNDPIKGQAFWVKMENCNDVKIHELLSSSHRRAATVKLSFEFPFYGRYIKNVTVATGGFIYTGNYVHSWLAATQYVAPLMANFDTGISNDSFVKYVDNGTAFTVEWEKVALQDKPKSEFTFQATLHKNGDIVFVYKTVPMHINEINDQQHPVKVGLSDAYILDRTVFYVRRKTIYEYHRVSFNKEEIGNWTTIYLKALPTCLDLLNCSSCVTNSLNLNCTWCPGLKQCSTGQDRFRQFWIDKGCEISNVTSPPKCSISYDEDSTLDEHINNSLNYDVEQSKYKDEDYLGGIPHRSPLGSSAYVVVIILIGVIIACGLWMTYAYRNPHTTSGQMLIRYRPSQWRWRRGEARYTAATIHM